MTSFVLRNARLVELGSGPGHATPIDLAIIEGRVAQIGEGLHRPAGMREYDAEGR